MHGERREAPFSLKQRNLNGAVLTQPTFPPTDDSSLEIRGTDTPPEKVPRQILRTSFKANEEAKGGSSLFSSIMHKFVKVDNRQNANGRYFSFLSF